MKKFLLALTKRLYRPKGHPVSTYIKEETKYIAQRDRWLRERGFKET